jgi:TPR repeat protein
MAPAAPEQSGGTEPVSGPAVERGAPSDIGHPAAAPIADREPPMAEKPASPGANVVEPAIARAQEAIRSGNIAAARSLLEYAAVTGDAGALFALAETYDPARLEAWGVVGIRPDQMRATDLYKKSAQRGNAMAAQRLKTAAKR